MCGAYRLYFLLPCQRPGRPAHLSPPDEQILAEQKPAARIEGEQAFPEMHLRWIADELDVEVGAVEGFARLLDQRAVGDSEAAELPGHHGGIDRHRSGKCVQKELQPSALVALEMGDKYVGQGLSPQGSPQIFGQLRCRDPIPRVDQQGLLSLEQVLVEGEIDQGRIKAEQGQVIENGNGLHLTSFGRQGITQSKVSAEDRDFLPALPRTAVAEKGVFRDSTIEFQHGELFPVQLPCACRG